MGNKSFNHTGKSDRLNTKLSDIHPSSVTNTLELHLFHDHHLNNNYSNRNS